MSNSFQGNPANNLIKVKPSSDSPEEENLAQSERESLTEEGILTTAQTNPDIPFQELPKLKKEFSILALTITLLVLTGRALIYLFSQL